jgi:hypothetical protein
MCLTETDGKQWRLTGFYGQPKRSLRKESWRMMQFLRNETDLPWLCSGDFNEVLHVHEQMGGNEGQEWCMEGFREAVEYCGFRDLSYSGSPYTWDNRRDGTANIKIRLDRALGDDKLLHMFGDSVVQHMQMAESDHCALLIQLRSTGSRQCGMPRKRPFRYENMWRRHHTYNSTVMGAWQGGCASLGDIVTTLSNLQTTFSSWEHEEFGSVRNELKKLRTQLERERRKNMSSGPSREERRIMHRLSELLAREETMEKQRSRMDWLHDGDRNTGFFHAKAKQRSRTNRIVSLKRDDGSLCMRQEEIGQMTIGFYKHLFTAQEATTPEEIVQHVPRKVTDSMNGELVAPYSAQEVQKALFMMHPNKAPGPDDLRLASIKNTGTISMKM